MKKHVFSLQTVENTVCVLRNLSYRLENEVDPQEGGEDVLDREWEQEQRRELEDLNRSFSKTSPGCLPFCIRPQTQREPVTPRVTLTSVVRTSTGSVDFAFPGQSVVPTHLVPASSTYFDSFTMKLACISGSPKCGLPEMQEPHFV